MALRERDTHSGALAADVARWVEAGILTGDQGERILQLEEGRSAPAATTLVTPVRRLTPVIELVSYLGIVLVAASGGVFVGREWNAIGVAGRIGVGLLVALIGLLGGRVVMTIDDPGARRLGGFLWLCGTGGLAMATAVSIDRLSGGNGQLNVMSTGLVVLTLSVALWRNLDRPLQFITSVGGLGMSVGGLVAWMGWRPSAAVIGMVVWVASLGLGVLGLKVLHPSDIVLFAAELGVLYSPMAVVASSQSLGLLLGIASAGGAVAAGLAMKRNAMVAVGVIGFFIYTVQMLTFYLHGPGTILAAFLIGATLVVIAIRRATHPGASGHSFMHRHHGV
jgi:hypothetical protein